MKKNNKNRTFIFTLFLIIIFNYNCKTKETLFSKNSKYVSNQDHEKNNFDMSQNSMNKENQYTLSQKNYTKKSDIEYKIDIEIYNEFIEQDFINIIKVPDPKTTKDIYKNIKDIILYYQTNNKKIFDEIIQKLKNVINKKKHINKKILNLNQQFNLGLSGEYIQKGKQFYINNVKKRKSKNTDSELLKENNFKRKITLKNIIPSVIEIQNTSSKKETFMNLQYLKKYVNINDINVPIQVLIYMIFYFDSKDISSNLDNDIKLNFNYYKIYLYLKEYYQNFFINSTNKQIKSSCHNLETKKVFKDSYSENKLYVLIKGLKFLKGVIYQKNKYYKFINTQHSICIIKNRKNDCKNTECYIISQINKYDDFYKKTYKKHLNSNNIQKLDSLSKITLGTGDCENKLKILIPKFFFYKKKYFNIYDNLDRKLNYIANKLNYVNKNLNISSDVINVINNINIPYNTIDASLYTEKQTICYYAIKFLILTYTILLNQGEANNINFVLFIKYVNNNFMKKILNLENVLDGNYNFNIEKIFTSEDCKNLKKITNKSNINIICNLIIEKYNFLNYNDNFYFINLNLESTILYFIVIFSELKKNYKKWYEKLLKN